MSLRFTDRALVRWLNRSGAADLEPLREAITASLSRAAAAADVLESARFNIRADGLVYIVLNGEVVNVIADDGRSGARNQF